MEVRLGMCTVMQWQHHSIKANVQENNMNNLGYRSYQDHGGNTNIEVYIKKITIRLH